MSEDMVILTTGSQPLCHSRTDVVIPNEKPCVSTKASGLSAEREGYTSEAKGWKYRESMVGGTRRTGVGGGIADSGINIYFFFSPSKVKQSSLALGSGTGRPQKDRRTFRDLYLCYSK